MLTAVVGAGEPPRVADDESDVIWWSFTKTLIAAAVLRLAERGRLDLDAPLAGRAFTPRALLQHSAGLADYGARPDYQAAVAAAGTPWSDDELLARVPDRPVDGLPWTYSNVGYLVLRRLVERLSDADLGAALHGLVLAPLGLRRARVARTIEDLAATAFPPPRGYHPGWVFHGTVVGPPSEAATALAGLMAGRLLAPASLEAMRTALPLGGGIPGRPWTTTGYGLGLMIGRMTDTATGRALDVAGHSAGGPGSTGAVYHAAENGRTAAVFVAGGSEGVAEHEAIRRLAEHRD